MVTQGARGGMEQNETGPTRAAEATGPTRAATTTGKDNRYACCYFLSLFLYFHLFFILLFFFSDYFFFDNCTNRRGTEEKSRTDGTGYTWAVIATWDGTEARRGQTGRTGTPSFIFLSCRISSFILVVLLLFRLSIFQWSTTTGGQDETNDNAGQDSQTTATDKTRPSGTGQDGTTRRQQCGTGPKYNALQML